MNPPLRETNTFRLRPLYGNEEAYKLFHVKQFINKKGGTAITYIVPLWMMFYFVKENKHD